MKILEPEFKIVDMPDGGAALAKLEQLGRIAYKSEDKIDNGYDNCPKCGGWNASSSDDGCEVCRGAGLTRVRDPSSHIFIRKILKAERKAKMIADAELYLQQAPNTHSHRQKASELVHNIVQYMLENPAHESIIEHCSATVKFRNNRGFTHELVRHRAGIVFTQESTRFCDYNKGKFGGEISVINRTFWGKAVDVEKLKSAVEVWRSTIETCEKGYQQLRSLGIAPEIARDLLPNALKADIGTTANFREWKLIFSLRCAPAAHPDMRALMLPLRDEFRKRIPIIFDDA